MTLFNRIRYQNVWYDTVFMETFRKGAILKESRCEISTRKLPDFQCCKYIKISFVYILWVNIAAFIPHDISKE